MRYLYSLGLYLVMPLIICRLYWRSLRAPGYRQRLKERFGFVRLPTDRDYQQGIWVHAVSMGESILAVPLILQLQAMHPGVAIIVTTTTPTGAKVVQEKLVPHGILHLYAPYDLPGSVTRFLARLQPKLAIMIETELWPNYCHYAHQRGIKIAIANARLSARSAANYQKVAPLVRPMLQQIDRIIAQTQADGERFIGLGLPPEHLTVTGSIKFDMQMPPDIDEKIARLTQLMGSERPRLIAASTHDGEEALILDAFNAVRQQQPELLLVLVPRHPERFNAVAQLCQARGLNVVKRSQKQRCDAKTHVFLGDSMGELLAYYGSADIAFVGGSLVATGGHNMLEPAAFAKPIICGPHLFNFQLISEMLIDAGAMLKIDDTAGLIKALLSLLSDRQLCERMGQAGKAVIAANRGALQRHIECLQPLL